jgi:hypothetical protein
MAWHVTFHARVEELGRTIESLREQVSKLPPTEALALVDIEARHADLYHTVLNFQVRAHEPRREVIDTLEVDFAELVHSVNKWLARQVAVDHVPLTIAARATPGGGMRASS